MESISQDEEAKAVYLRAALRHVDRGYKHIYPDSLVGKSIGNVGPWNILAGSFEWNDNQLQCISSGDVILSNMGAYGGWYYRLMKFGSTSTSIIGFIASALEDINGSSQDGYSLSFSSTERVVLQRRDNGVPTSLAGIVTDPNYIVNGVTYETFISRITDSTFQVWIRGGIYTNWISIGTRLEATYIDSNFITGNLDTGDILSHLHYFPYGMGLTPNMIPWLAD